MSESITYYNTGNMKDLLSSEPKAHTQNLKAEMQKLVDYLRKDIEKVDEPQAKTLFETSAEVLKGLINAFEHYEKKNDKAWK